MRVLDLFCGMGNFSIPLAVSGAEVTGVESSDVSVSMACENAERNGVTADFVSADCRRFLAEARDEGYDAVSLIRRAGVPLA
jgi:23S rRNA (uracil1939-C5)-methyltransferase